MARILVTGGAGYIGSHTCLELLEAGHDVVVLDNFDNSSPVALARVEALTGRSLPYEECDILDTARVTKLLKTHKTDAVIHFAGLKAVGESVAQPLRYYLNNFIGTHSLLTAMADADVKKVVFSSSATVYGDPQYLPLDESHPLSTTNPYGQTKLIIEEMLRDLYVSDPSWQISILRYFNPCGAHHSGDIGENPKGIPNNLMPFITQVATGHREELSIFGEDYDTPDGTGVRDYIHVVDLAQGHLKALDSLSGSAGCVSVNLGTGVGYSVLDMVKAFEAANSLNIPYKLALRRPGDIASCFANPDFAKSHLGWESRKSLTDMCRDSWNWQSKNPKGYPEQQT